jgi:RIO-like serine/threonine protein kinase
VAFFAQEMNPSRDELTNGVVAVLNTGRFANATVRLCRVNGAEWIMKDLAPKRWIVRLLYGWPIMRRELKALRQLQGLRGIPQDAFRVDRDAIAYRHTPGRTLATCPRGEYPAGYFPALEKLVKDMHAMGVAHLDIRYMHNVLVCNDGSPALIDFQTALHLPHHIKWLANLMQRVDISGVYKHWLKRSPETLDAERLAMLERQNQQRRYWILTGYLGRRARARKKKEKLKLQEARKS